MSRTNHEQLVRALKDNIKEKFHKERAAAMAELNKRTAPQKLEARRQKLIDQIEALKKDAAAEGWALSGNYYHGVGLALNMNPISPHPTIADINKREAEAEAALSAYSRDILLRQLQGEKMAWGDIPLPKELKDLL